MPRVRGTYEYITQYILLVLLHNVILGFICNVCNIEPEKGLHVLFLVQCYKHIAPSLDFVTHFIKS